MTTPSIANSSGVKAGRLTVTYLMCLMAGVGIAISISRAIERLRFPADSLFYGLNSPAETGLYGMVVASIYGLCLTTFVFAARSGRIWESPGKTLALLFAAVCILNWALDAFAAAVVSYRIDDAVSHGIRLVRGAGVGVVDSRVWGIWYNKFAPSVGYVVAFPLLAYVSFKTCCQPLTWRFVWVGFIIFDVLIVANICFYVARWFPVSFRYLYFELILGLPTVLIAVALLNALLRRQRIDWWTTVVAVPMLAGWTTILGVKLIAWM